jgi:thiamine biosynthesis protein ThiI
MQGNVEQVLLIRYAEIHLKGLNRPYFERRLQDAIRRALRGTPARVERRQSRMYVYGLSEEQVEPAIERLRRVFGVHSVSPALSVDVSYDAIAEAACSLMEAELQERPGASFKVFARRADKSFPMHSDEICRELGSLLLKRFPALRVDVHRPDISVGVEVRERGLVYMREIPCAGGMPVGCNGRAALLISGGIDSPVAGYMIAKRGVSLSAVHFFSYPYTSERARDKVVALVRLLSRYAEEIRLHLVPFTDIQLAIYEKCPSSQTTVLMRRLMMRIAERYRAGGRGARSRNGGVDRPGREPDSRKPGCYERRCGYACVPSSHRLRQAGNRGARHPIGTYETSILPYEDCCTVFVPQHPITRPTVDKLRESEALVDFTDMIESALSQTELVVVTPDD